MMRQTPAFHGSDLEKIASCYHIPKEEIIPFGANVNPLGLSETVRQDLAEHLDLLTQYPDRNYTSLKETIADYAGCLPKQVIVGNGTTELISLVISRQAPKKALVLGPTYSEYERELSFVGGKMETYNLKETADFRLDIADFISHLTEDIDMVILCNPNNPTSSCLSQAELSEVIGACRERDIFVMIDETYIEFTPDIETYSAVPLADTYENFLVLRGVSKFFAAPGLRFGYGICGNPALLDELTKRQNPWSLSSLGAYAGERMLKDTDYIHKTRDLIEGERTRILAALSESPDYKPYPAYANFILVQIQKEGVTSADLFEKAIREKMMIRDCSSFTALEGEYIRFCIMRPEENNHLLTCLLGT